MAVWAFSSSSTTDLGPCEVAALVALVSEQYRDTLTRRFVGGETHEQMAALCGVGRVSVGRHIAVALGHIRDAIA